MLEYSELSDKLEKLTLGTEYTITQENGQRKYGPPRDWVGPPPPKGCEVFIGKLPRELFEDELVPVFASVGKIYELRMMLNFSGSNRGYAFLNYSTRAEATAAITKLHNYEIRPGHRLGVVKSVDNCHLYIGGIPKTKNVAEVAEELSKHVPDVVNVTLHKGRLDNLNKGFAYVEFKTHRAAAMARRRLVPGFVRLWDKEIEVEWAELGNDNCKNEEIKKMAYKNTPTKDLLKSTTLEYDDVFKSPVFRLEELCKRNGWPLPEYTYKKITGTEGTEFWMCSVEFLEDSMSCLPKFISQPSLTLGDAQMSTAAACLFYIQQKKQQLMQQYHRITPITPPWRQQHMTTSIPLKM